MSASSSHFFFFVRIFNCRIHRYLFSQLLAQVSQVCIKEREREINKNNNNKNHEHFRYFLAIAVLFIFHFCVYVVNCFVGLFTRTHSFASWSFNVAENLAKSRIICSFYHTFLFLYSVFSFWLLTLFLLLPL